MKHLFFSLAMAMIAISNLHAQDVQHYSSMRDLPRKKHCIATRVGEGIMIGGGTVAAVSIIGYGIDVSIHPEDKNNLTFIIPVLFTATGLGLILDGGIVLLCGKLYERSHYERFSFVGTRNTVGLAYNFR